MSADVSDRFGSTDNPDSKCGEIGYLSFGGQTDSGRKRLENQDNFALAAREYSASPGKGFLMAVADGMGGRRGGEVASKLALGVLISEYYKMSSHDVKGALVQAVSRANEAVHILSGDDKNYKKMGTTLTAVVLKDYCMSFAHVGDSRGYIVSKRKIEQFTRDHSYVAGLVRAGKITKEEAVNHPSENIITRAVGSRPEIDPDFSEENIVLKKGQYVLLCSDGLFKVVPDHDIFEAVRTWVAPDLIAKKLIGLANKRGGPDNITVVNARIEIKQRPMARAMRMIGLTK